MFKWALAILLYTIICVSLITWATHNLFDFLESLP